MAQEIADSTLLDTWSSSGNIVEPDISKIIEGWQLGEQPPHEYMNWLQNTFGSKLNHILKNGVASWNNETQYLAGATVQHNGNVWLCKTTNTNSEPTDVNANWKRIITVESLTTVLGGYVALTGNQTIAGVKTFSSTITGSISGNSATATKLATARTINGVSFNGTANIVAPTNLGITAGTTAGPIVTSSTGTNATLPTASASASGVVTTGNQTWSGVKTFSASPIVPTPTTGTQAVNKNYADLKVALAEFTGANQNLTVNGYQKLPGGLIIQWGTAMAGRNGTSITNNFPISFLNSGFSLTAIHEGVVPIIIIVNNLTKTNFNLSSNNTINDVFARYIAIGY